MGAKEEAASTWYKIKSLFYMAKSDTFKLARIEFLVVVIALLLLLMFMLDTYKRRSRSSLVKFILLILDTASSSMVTYTIGLMQVANFKNELFDVWAVLLVTLQQSVVYIFDYSPEDRQNRRRRGLQNIMDSFWTANLTATRGTKFELPIWLLWGLNQLRIIHGMVAFEMADRSYSHGRNSGFVAVYMSQDHTPGKPPEEADPATMRGYKYLVHGKPKQKWEAEAPDDAIRLKIINEDELVTLDKIWRCEGHLLGATGDPHRKLKHLCLSFALYKLLRLKFDNLYPLPDSDDPKARKLVFQGLLAEDEDHNRAFRVIEVELAFLNDFLFTRYPIFFCRGFPFFYNIVCLLVVASCCLLLSVLFLCKLRDGKNVSHFVHGVNVDVVITSCILVVIIIKEVWELVTYMLSDWAKVFLICEYVKRPSWQGCALIEKALRLWCNATIVKCWHKELRQYCLLESYDYSPRFRTLLSYATLGMVSKATEGGRKGTKIKLPEDVKKFILRSLRDQSLLSTGLSNGVFSLQQNQVSEQLSWACGGQTDTNTILVWHIATSMCEIKLSKQYNVDIKILHSSLLSTKNRCFRPHFLETLSNLDGDLQSRYKVATSLSQYCAYLVLFCPNLLHDRSQATEFIFEKTIEKARKFLRGCDSMETIYEKMMVFGEEAEDEGEEANAIIKMGAKLGKTLMEENEAKHWKVLAEFWAELVLYLAPSSNTSAHKDCLATGGEFITHLWVLVSHAGFLERPPAP